MVIGVRVSEKKTSVVQLRYSIHRYRGGLGGAHRGATKCLGTGRDGVGRRVVDFLWTRQHRRGGKAIYMCVWL